MWRAKAATLRRDIQRSAMSFNWPCGRRADGIPRHRRRVSHCSRACSLCRVRLTHGSRNIPCRYRFELHDRHSWPAALRELDWDSSSDSWSSHWEEWLWDTLASRLAEYRLRKLFACTVTCSCRRGWCGESAAYPSFGSVRCAVALRFLGLAQRSASRSDSAQSHRADSSS